MSELVKKIGLAVILALVTAVVTYYATSYLNRKRSQISRQSLLAEALATEQANNQVAPAQITNVVKSPCGCGQH